MTRISWPVALVALVVSLHPGPARAFEISGSVAYWTESSSAYSVTLGKFWDLPGFQLGPRVGFAYVTSPNSSGVPADLVARLGLGIFYIEGQAGSVVPLLEGSGGEVPRHGRWRPRAGPGAHRHRGRVPARRRAARGARVDFAVTALAAKVRLQRTGEPG